MSKGIVNLQETELTAFIKEVENGKEVKLMVNGLKKSGKIKSTEYTVLKSGKSQLTDTNANYLVLGFDQGAAKIVAIKTDFGIQAFTSIIEKKSDKEVLRGFRVVHNRIESMITLDYDDKFKQSLLELDSKDLPELSRETGIKVDFPCIYGNWCGPGCSGPAAS